MKIRSCLNQGGVGHMRGAPPLARLRRQICHRNPKNSYRIDIELWGHAMDIKLPYRAFSRFHKTVSAYFEHAGWRVSARATHTCTHTQTDIQAGTQTNTRADRQTDRQHRMDKHQDHTRNVIAFDVRYVRTRLGNGP